MSMILVSSLSPIKAQGFKLKLMKKRRKRFQETTCTEGFSLQKDGKFENLTGTSSSSNILGPVTNLFVGGDASFETYLTAVTLSLLLILIYLFIS